VAGAPIVVFFDLETQRTFQEVGGPRGIEKLGLAVGVTYSTATDRYVSYEEKDVDDLLSCLAGADLVVGFNSLAFDYRVLAPYAGGRLSGVKSLDMLDEIRRELGFRVSLDSLAQATLGEGKAGHGLEAVKWFRQGLIDRVVAYCTEDVRITRRLFEHGLVNGVLYYTDRRSGAFRSVPASWSRSEAAQRYLAIMASGEPA